MNYSIVIYATDKNDLEKTLMSINSQKYDLTKVEIIVENINDEEFSSTDIKNFDYLNIIYNDKIASKAEAYNHALTVATGKYITFINSDMYYESNKTLSLIEKYLHETDIVAINGGYFDSDKKKRIPYVMQPKKTQLINLYAKPYTIQLLFSAYFFKRELLRNHYFDNTLHEECQIKLLLEILDTTFVYKYLEELKLTSKEPFEDNTSKCSIQYNLWWYKDSVDRLINPLLDSYSKIPEYIEEICMYLIFAKFNCNTQDRNKNVLSQTDFAAFKESVLKALVKIDDKIILQTSLKSISGKGDKHQFKIPRWLRFWFIDKKIALLEAKKNIIVSKINNHHNTLLEYTKDNKKTKAYISTDRAYNLSEKVKIKAINYKDFNLQIDASVSISDFLPTDEINIIAELDNKKVPLKKTAVYSSLKAFGVNLANEYTFMIDFKVDLLKKQQLKFYALINGKKLPLNLRFDKVQARLSKSKRSFWSYKGIMLKNKISYLTIEKSTTLKVIKAELLYDLSKLKNENNKIRVLKLIGLRFIYYLTRPFYKNKHLWITFDKLYKAGDNGEYIYQYGLKHNRNIYYIIKRESLDYKRLLSQKHKKILKYNSLKAKLLSLHAEVILKTHANVISYCGFDGLAREMFSGLYNADLIEIQHGLTIQEIAQYQNRLFDNIKHYCCASKYEVKNIHQEEYGFDKKDISLTGLARYDGLKSNDKKIILITPTWRRNIVNSNIVHVKKSHNENFRNSEYFKIYNSLINNKKLIEVAKETGYNIIYLLHPATSSQIDDYDKNDYVELIPATGDMSYEKILTESSLMVTDYSGVQFDFAYQRKPIVYYHPNALPPHYQTGIYDYETMAFGPICKTEQDLVDELCSYMRKKCSIKKKYEKRADDFFAYNDYNNCQRIVEAVDKYLNDK